MSRLGRVGNPRTDIPPNSFYSSSNTNAQNKKSSFADENPAWKPIVHWTNQEFIDEELEKELIKQLYERLFL